MAVRDAGLREHYEKAQPLGKRACPGNRATDFAC
jgi:hypothetical protein